MKGHGFVRVLVPGGAGSIHGHTARLGTDMAPVLAIPRRHRCDVVAHLGELADAPGRADGRRWWGGVVVARPVDRGIARRSER